LNKNFLHYIQKRTIMVIHQLYSVLFVSHDYQFLNICRCHENPSPIRKHNPSLSNTTFCLQPLHLLLQLMYLLYSCSNIFFKLYFLIEYRTAWQKPHSAILVCFSVTEIQHMWPESSETWTLKQLPCCVIVFLRWINAFQIFNWLILAG